MTVHIRGGNLRDLSYIAANLRPEDLEEIDCQLESWTPEFLALSAMQGFAYVAELDGNPEAAFGATQQRQGLWIAWAWGTKRMRRCIPHMTRFITSVLWEDVANSGAHRVEARPIASNRLAVSWLKKIGGTERCLLPAYGKNGEDFVLFDWTKESEAHVPRQSLRQAA